jgi:hypothetical protein
MKVVFVGPTVPDAGQLIGVDTTVRPPAVQGDIIQAVRDGATVIGLIDGNFEYVAPIWHKEILFALAKGISVLGASSMGALRAAECDCFGMIGIGSIYGSYARGELVDDADVAQLHAPAELGYRALTEPLVNVRATLDHLLCMRLITNDEWQELLCSATSIFFKKRTWTSIAAEAKLQAPSRKSTVEELLKKHTVDLKRKDALTLLARLSEIPDRRSDPTSNWEFQVTSMWRNMESR